MNDTFHHSIKVPTQYKKAAKILKSSIEQGASLKGEIFTEKHAVRLLFMFIFIIYYYYFFLCNLCVTF